MNRVIVAATHRPLRLILVTHSAACAAGVRAALAAEDVVWTRQIDDALRQPRARRRRLRAARPRASRGPRHGAASSACSRGQVPVVALARRRRRRDRA